MSVICVTVAMALNFHFNFVIRALGLGLGLKKKNMLLNTWELGILLMVLGICKRSVVCSNCSAGINLED